MFICKTASIRWLSRSCLATAAWYTPHRKYSLGSCPFSFHSGSSIQFKMLFKDNRAPNNYYIWRPLHSSFILLTLPVPASSSRWDPHLGISCVSNVTTSARERRMRRSTGLIHTYCTSYHSFVGRTNRIGVPGCLASGQLGRCSVVTLIKILSLEL